MFNFGAMMLGELKRRKKGGVKDEELLTLSIRARKHYPFLFRLALGIKRGEIEGADVGWEEVWGLGEELREVSWKVRKETLIRMGA